MKSVCYSSKLYWLQRQILPCRSATVNPLIMSQSGWHIHVGMESGVLVWLLQHRKVRLEMPGICTFLYRILCHFLHWYILSFWPQMTDEHKSVRVRLHNRVKELGDPLCSTVLIMLTFLGARPTPLKWNKLCVLLKGLSFDTGSQTHLQREASKGQNTPVMTGQQKWF